MTGVASDAGPSAWEGAGVLSSYADLNEALGAEHVDPWQVLATAAGAGLDTLGVIKSPFGSMLEAGFGWLIEHVDFLSEPLDALAGDPDAVLAQARAWQAVSAELTATADGYRSSAAAVARGWDGAAADAYVGAVERCTAAIDSSARDAAQLSDVIVSTGAAVGTVRAIIRDWIARFCADVVQWFVGAAVAAALSAGISLGVLVVTVVQEACSLGRRFLRRISQLLDLLDAAGGTARELGETLRATAAQLTESARQAAQQARPVAEAIRDAAGRARDLHHDLATRVAPIDDLADRVRAGKLVEGAKQEADAEQDQRGWS